jgi:N-acetylglucosaminyldiphosphoundecaprenol N-acetyl-beta-D-mannosaminyltransferase
MTEPEVETYRVLSVRVAATNLHKAANIITRWAREKKRTYVCVAPVSTIVDCEDSPSYRQVVNGAGMTTPDGMPVVWLGKGQRFDVDRTYGPDLMELLCDVGQTNGQRHFFFGGTDESLEKLLAALRRRFPKLNIAGAYAPPFKQINQLEEQSVLDQINQANADILWVGLGSPKQDFWMRNHRDRLKVPVMIGAGAAFDFLAGTKRQAPRWIQRSGFEWLFRLGTEPRRLWRRYLVGNSKFIAYLARDLVLPNKTA